MNSGVLLGAGIRNPSLCLGGMTGWSVTPPIHLVGAPSLKLMAQTKDGFGGEGETHTQKQHGTFGRFQILF